MGTIKVKNNPQSRIDVGNHVLEAAKTVDVRVIKAKLATFAKIHGAYASAHASAQAAEDKLDAAQSLVGEMDGVQDAAVTLLAAKMIGDGAPKANPLSLFKLPAPSTLIDLAVEVEVKKTKLLAKKAASWKNATAPTKAAAKTLGKAAADVEKALAKVAPAQRAHAAAISKREALGVPWTRSLAHLKNAARVAEDDGQVGLFEALFGAPGTKVSARPVHAPADGIPAQVAALVLPADGLPRGSLPRSSPEAGTPRG